MPNDYTKPLRAAEMPTGIDAAKLANGSVSNAEFQTLSDISTGSTIQTQINGKAATPTGTPNGSKYLRDDNSWQAVSATDSTKLPLAGGTMTGPVGFSGTQTSAGNTTTNIFRGSSGEASIISAWLNLGWNGVNYHTIGSTGWQLVSGTTGAGNSVTNIFRGGNDELNLHGAGGCAVVSGRLVARANSTAYGLCAAATGDVLRCLLQDDGNKRAVALVAANGTVTFEAGSHADYVASSSPASGEVGVYISSGILTIKPGSAGARSIAASADRARA